MSRININIVKEDFSCSSISPQETSIILKYINNKSLESLGINPLHCYQYNLLYIPDFILEANSNSYRISDLIDLVSDLSEDSIFPEEVVFGFSESYSIPHSNDSSIKFGFDSLSLDKYLSQLESITFSTKEYIPLLKETLKEISHLFDKFKVSHIIIRDQL